MVTGADIGLPPDYAIVGEVTDGLDVVELIGALGDPQTEQPLQPVVIESVTVVLAVSRVAAVVLAAGAATRFGSPKQELLLPDVLERLEGPPSTRSSSSRAPTHCATGRRGAGPDSCAAPAGRTARAPRSGAASRRWATTSRRRSSCSRTARGSQLRPSAAS